MSISAKTENQKKYLKALYTEDLVLCEGDPGCVDKDTEFLSQNGWKKIVDYTEDDLVMQFDIDKNVATLVKPDEYIKLPCEEFNYLKSSTGIDQMLSDDHKVLYKIKGRYDTKTAKDLVDICSQNKSEFSGRFIVDYKYEGFKINMTDDMIRLHVVMKAVSTPIKIKTTGKYRINIKKQRKKDRLEWLLAKNNIDYHKGDTTNGFSHYDFYMPNFEKRMSEWMFCSQHDALVITDELKYWDECYQSKGNRMPNFFSCFKEDVDAVQYFYNILGYRCPIHHDVREGRNTRYYASPTIRNTPAISKGKKSSITRVKSEDGFKYCFSVPSGFLVLRRNDSVFVTGNSGKDFVAIGVYLDMILKDKYKQNKLIITRPLVTCGMHDLGSLPGTVSERTLPYALPMISIMQELTDVKTARELLEKRIVEFIPLELMRGYTFTNSCVLLSEMQNSTPQQAIMAITRMGHDSHFCFNGDIDQKDIRVYSGLEILIDTLSKTNLCEYIRMGPADNQRNPKINSILKAIDWNGTI